MIDVTVSTIAIMEQIVWAVSHRKASEVYWAVCSEVGQAATLK